MIYSIMLVSNVVRSLLKKKHYYLKLYLHQPGVINHVKFSDSFFLWSGEVLQSVLINTATVSLRFQRVYPHVLMNWKLKRLVNKVVNTVYSISTSAVVLSSGISECNSICFDQAQTGSPRGFLQHKGVRSACRLGSVLWIQLMQRWEWKTTPAPDNISKYIKSMKSCINKINQTKNVISSSVYLTCNTIQLLLRISVSRFYSNYYV